MNYKTLEVDLEDGKVVPKDGSTLPSCGRALLTILDSEDSAPKEAPRESLAQRVAEFSGIGHGTKSDLSSNKKQLDDFGA